LFHFPKEDGLRGAMKNSFLGKLVLGGSPTFSQKMMILWGPDLKTTNLEQLSPTFAEYRFYEGAFSVGF
jgi:hypothetical protein